MDENKDIVLVLSFKCRMLHFGTAFSNNSMKMSSNVPCKSMIMGLIGASQGLSFIESQELSYDISFKWLDETRINNQYMKMNRIVYEGSLRSRNMLLSKKWLDNNMGRTIDSVEYIYNENGFISFEILISNIKDKEDLDNLKMCFLNPEYPLYLGKSDSLLSLIRVDDYMLTRYFDLNTFSGFFIGDSEGYVLKERLVEKMSSYRVPDKFESVYTLNYPLEGVSKNGYYLIDNNCYSIW